MCLRCKFFFFFFFFLVEGGREGGGRIIRWLSFDSAVVRI